MSVPLLVVGRVAPSVVPRPPGRVTPPEPRPGATEDLAWMGLVAGPRMTARDELAWLSLSADRYDPHLAERIA